MKIGVLTFGYQNFDVFGQHLAKSGFYTVNLGDNMQSIAVRLLLQRLGVQQENIISVNRDDLANYDGPPVAMIMNGVFPGHAFPLPAHVLPLFVGFNTDEATIRKHRDYFCRFQPIGCRDSATAELFEKHRVHSFVTGCLSMTIPKRASGIVARKLLLVYGGVYASGVGHFPSRLLQTIPEKYQDNTEFVFQRLPVFEFPMSEKLCQAAESYAQSLLEYYSENAALIVTSLHHAATPAMALGIPLIICRAEMDPRFTYLAKITRVYTSADIHEIDWEPEVITLDDVRAQLEALVARIVFEALEK